MLRSTLSFLLLFFASLAYAGNGFFEGLIDPKTGMIDNTRLKRYDGPVFPPYEDEDSNFVSSIRLDNDFQTTITMKDGSKRVFQKDPLHPEKGWKRTR